MNCFTSLNRMMVERGVILSDLAINAQLTVLIVEKYELFRCVALSAVNETKLTMYEEDPPLLLGLVRYIVMCTPVVEDTVRRNICKR